MDKRLRSNITTQYINSKILYRDLIDNQIFNNKRFLQCNYKITFALKLRKQDYNSRNIIFTKLSKTNTNIFQITMKNYSIVRKISKNYTSTIKYPIGQNKSTKLVYSTINNSVQTFCRFPTDCSYHLPGGCISPDLSPLDFKAVHGCNSL